MSSVQRRQSSGAAIDSSFVKLILGNFFFTFFLLRDTLARVCEMSPHASLIITKPAWDVPLYKGVRTHASTHTQQWRERNPERFLSLKGWGLFCRLEAGASLCSCTPADRENVDKGGQNSSPSKVEPNTSMFPKRGLTWRAPAAGLWLAPLLECCTSDPETFGTGFSARCKAMTQFNYKVLEATLAIGDFVLVTNQRPLCCKIVGKM